MHCLFSIVFLFVFILLLFSFCFFLRVRLLRVFNTERECFSVILAGLPTCNDNDNDNNNDNNRTVRLYYSDPLAHKYSDALLSNATWRISIKRC